MINEINNVAHYTKLKNLEKILNNKKILLGKISGLNDPRENSLGWIDTCGLGHNIDSHKWKEAERLRKAIGKNLRVFCTAGFCKEDENQIDIIESKIYGRPRMWAQYGDNSKGFCVVFNKERLNEEIELQLKTPKNIIHGMIEYFDWLSIVSGGSTIEYGEGHLLRKEQLFEMINSNQMLKSIYFRKNIDWKHEREYRWLIYSNRRERFFVPIQSSIEYVVLGCKFPPDKYSLVKEYCIALGCSCFVLKYEYPKYQLVEISQDGS